MDNFYNEETNTFTDYLLILLLFMLEYQKYFHVL